MVALADFFCTVYILQNIRSLPKRSSSHSEYPFGYLMSSVQHTVKSPAFTFGQLNCCCFFSIQSLLKLKDFMSPQVPFVWREPPGGFQSAERCLHPHGLASEDFEEGGRWLGISAAPMGPTLPLAEPQYLPDPYPMGRVLQPHQPAGQCACHWVWGIHCWWAFRCLRLEFHFLKGFLF